MPSLQGWPPLLMFVLFLVCATVQIWRLNAMANRGLAGTALGALVMPYCSGMGNLLFVAVMLRQSGPGEEVLVNALVNNATNLTLLLGLPSVLFTLAVIPAGRLPAREAVKVRLNRLSLLLTLAAALFFTGTLWALGRDGTLDFGDGIVLVGLFFFWQGVSLFDVARDNVRERTRLPLLPLAGDAVILAATTVGLYLSLDGLVAWLSALDGSFLNASHLGWVTGWLLVLPNALLALYYGWKNRADIVYSSQVGDGHICIPLCIGVFCIFETIDVGGLFNIGLILIAGAAFFHVVFVALLGRLPRWAGVLCLVAYGVFVWMGLS